MKKLLFIILLAGVNSVVYAQRFEGGLIGGFNASQVDGDTYRGFYKPGILAGAYVRTDLAPAIFSGMEIKYSQKGSRSKYDPKNPDMHKYIMRLGYVEVPVFLGFRASNRSSVVGGISTGYLVQAQERDENGPFPKQDQHPFNNIDVQPFLGFQFDMLDKVRLDLRIAYSVLPIRGQPGQNATTYYWLNNQFNDVISLAIYYSLNSGRY
jgi:Outer membrane protein beta-barrel domain